MKFLNLVSILLCSTILTETGVAQYQWSCSLDDEYGEMYIPSVRDYEGNVLTGVTNGGEIHLYRVQNLNAECYGEVTAIDFCYQYNTFGLGEPVFNWTVLIIEETNFFTITRIISIESRPNALSGADCVNTGITKAKCCDREYISSYNFQTNNFVFGVTESPQGNTHGATLLGFFESQLEYIVHTLLISAAGKTIAEGSTLIRPNTGIQRGLRMLWFVIGAPPPTDATSLAISLSTTSSPNPTTPDDREIDLTTNAPILSSTHNPKDQRINDDTTSLPDLTSTHDQRVGFSTTNTLDLTTTSTRDEGITEHITTNSLNSASTHNDTNHMHDTTSSLSPTNTDMHNQESRTSIPASTTEVSVVSNSQETVRIIPYAVGRAMGGLVVITVITLVTVIVTFIIKRKQQKSHEVESFNNNGLPKLAYDNAVYNLAGGSRANGTIEYATTSFDISANVESESFSTNVYDSVMEQTKVKIVQPQDYILPISSKN